MGRAAPGAPQAVPPPAGRRHRGHGMRQPRRVPRVPSRAPRPSAVRPRSAPGGRRASPSTRASSARRSSSARPSSGSTKGRSAPKRKRRRRGRRAHVRAATPTVDPEVLAEIHVAAADPRRADRLAERLTSAAAALDRERFDDARRMVAPVVRELPRLAAGHEISGLANYRMGRWREAGGLARAGAPAACRPCAAAGAGRLLPGDEAMDRGRRGLARDPRAVAVARGDGRGADRRRRGATPIEASSSRRSP